MTTASRYRTILEQNAAAHLEDAAFVSHPSEIDRAVSAYSRRTVRKQIEAEPVEVEDAWADEYEAEIEDEVLTPMFAAVAAYFVAGAVWRAGRVSIPATASIPELPSLVLRARTIPAVVNTEAVRAIAQDHVTTVAAAHKRTMVRNVNRALRTRSTNIRALLQEDQIRSALNNRIAENVRLIRSIEPRLHADLVRVMRQRLASDKPFDRDSLAKILQERFGVTESRAKLIARDQTSKLVGQLSELRQRQLGVTHFKWRDAGDASVRSTHRAANGNTYSWSSPPAIGKPGEPINCRCVAIPIIPDRLRGQLTRDPVPMPVEGT